MRRIFPLLGVVVLALGACAQTTRWEKPQATEEATAADLQDCRVQAQKEAFRTVGPYPLRAIPSTDRLSIAARATNTNRGCARSSISPKTG